MEHVRLGIPTSTPLAVQQWDGIIAVNYAARKFGVKRGDRADVTLKKCPQIKLVHVETISADSATADGSGGGGGGGGNNEADAAATAGAAGARRDKGACKVSLERLPARCVHCTEQYIPYHTVLLRRTSQYFDAFDNESDSRWKGISTGRRKFKFIVRSDLLAGGCKSSAFDFHHFRHKIGASSAFSASLMFFSHNEAVGQKPVGS